MQKLILITLLGLLISFSSNGQTTLEEYNYVTKGYKIQIESGLDMKSGYKFKELHTNWTTANSQKGQIKRTMKFMGLYRKSEQTPCAVLIIYKRLDNNYQDYICIPHWESSKEVWNMFYKKIEKYGKEGATTLVWGLGKSLSFFAKE